MDEIKEIMDEIKEIMDEYEQRTEAVLRER